MSLIASLSALPKNLVKAIPGLTYAYRFATLIARSRSITNTMNAALLLDARLGNLQRVRLIKFVAASQSIPGWTDSDEALALAFASFCLGREAVVVEIGTFLGRSAVVLAGSRFLCGSGKLHCVDSFDAGGDKFSVPVYRRIQTSTPKSLRRQFEENVRLLALDKWVHVHQGPDVLIGKTWAQPIDLLFLDANHSRAGAEATYLCWARFLKVGGIIAIHNSSDKSYAADHEGSRYLVLKYIRTPEFEAVCCVGSTTFARKTDKACLAA